MEIEAITKYLHRHLPLTKAMGLAATAYDGASRTLVAPLEPNLNNSGTAFGGSIATLAITAGWMALHLLLEREGISHRLVIQKSTVSFDRPIDADVRAQTERLADDRAAAFVDDVRRRRRARITLQTKVFSQAQLAATHEGVYVALAY